MKRKRALVSMDFEPGLEKGVIVGLALLYPSSSKPAHLRVSCSRFPCFSFLFTHCIYCYKHLSTYIYPLLRDIFFSNL